MQAHFSILSASIRPEIQEQLAIGLLLVGSNSVHFDFSKNKLTILNDLLTPQALKYLKDTVKQISQASSNEKEKFKGLFTESGTISKSFSLGYLEYLSKYSNNLLTFSSPKTIELPADDALFKMLFNKYIDENAFIEKISAPRNFDTLKSVFFPKVEPYFNVEQEITSENVSGLLMPVKVDLIGKNEIPVYAHLIDLERKNYNIQNDLAVVFMLNKAFENKAKGFHISAEPDKTKFPGQHETWKSIRNWKDSEYVDISEIQMIERYATEHGVVPLIK